MLCRHVGSYNCKLCSDAGVPRSVDGAEILYARQKLVMTCKAHGLQAIDMVHIDFKGMYATGFVRAMLLRFLHDLLLLLYCVFVSH